MEPIAESSSATNALTLTFRNKHGQAPMLTSSNYFVWSKAIKYTLQSGNAWDIVMEQEQEPAAPAANATARVLERYEDKLTNYRARHSYAATTIYQSCTPAIQVYINNDPSPADMWRILNQRVNLMTDTRAPTELRYKLYVTRFDGEGSIEAFITTILQYRDQLASTHEALTDEEVVKHIVQNLPASWYHARNLILEKPLIERTIQYVRRTLIRHEEDIQRLAKEAPNKPAPTDSNALLTSASKNTNPSTRGQNQPRGRSRGRAGHRGRGRGGHRGGQRSASGSSSHKGKEKSQDQEDENRCWYCTRPGHTISECRAKKQADSWAEERATKKRKTSEVNLACSAILTISIGLRNSTSRDWCIDSGATDHICNSRAMFQNFQKLDTPHTIYMGNGSHTKAIGVGHIELQIASQNTLQLSNVLYAPDMKYNLIAALELEKNYRVVLMNSICTIYHPSGRAILETERTNGLILIQATATPAASTMLATLRPRGSRAVPALPLVISPVIPIAELSEEEPDNAIIPATMQLWHRRLGHLNEAAITKLTKISDGITLTSKDLGTSVCKPCLDGKQHNVYNRQPVSRATKRLELIHSDLYGPFSHPTISQHRYFILYIDDYSRMTWLMLLHSKGASDVIKAFKNFKAAAENQSGHRICRFRCDNARGEFNNDAFKGILAANGITYEPSDPYTPHQNGVSERKNRTITEKARSMLHDTSLPQSFWAEACVTANYLANRSPTRALDDMTPYEAWSGKRLKLHHIRRFGCDAHRLVKHRKDKVQARSRCCIMLGYVHDTTKIWKLWDPVQKAVIHADVIKFDEDNNTAAIALRNTVTPAEATVIPLPAVTATENAATPAKDTVTSLPATTAVEVPLRPPETLAERVPHTAARRSEEAIPMRTNTMEPEAGMSGDDMGDTIVVRPLFPRLPQALLAAPDLPEPASYHEAITGPEHVQWLQAMNEEHSALIKNNTWQLEELPMDRNVIASKWVYKKKPNANGTVRYKARLVIKGFMQQYGIDYDETFAPVAKLKTIRIVLALAAYHDWEVHHMDVKTAFLNPKLDREVYMTQPEGFEQGTSVCRLLKSLYGLKQAPRAWHEDVNAYLRSIGFQNSTSDPNLYLSSEVILILFVDDTLIAARTVTALNALKGLLTAKYDMTDLGEACQFLGLQIYRDRKNKKIHINQSQYIARVLARYGLSDCNGLSIPMDPSNNLRAAGPHDEVIDQLGYQSKNGSMMYAMIGTRPDLAFPVATFSKFNSAPTQLHHGAAKRALRYLQPTIDYGITYNGTLPLDLVGYSDSDWANDKDTRKSTGGYVFTLLGGAVSWKSKQQPTVALSSTEAEYMGYTETAKEAIWLRNILIEIETRKPLSSSHNGGHDSKWAKDPTTIRVDNKGAMDLTANTKHHERTKHIDIRHHFIRETIQRGLVSVMKVSTEDQTADILTKPLARAKFEEHRRSMGVTSKGSSIG